MAAPHTIATTPAAQLGEHTRRRIALRLLPFLFLLYVVNYLDRTNLAYAAVGMARDVGFSDRVFGLGAGIFFLSYVALQIPGALMVDRWGARRIISGCMITWGSLTALTSLVHTPMQLYLARFVLGAAEAGYFPGVIVYLGYWFVSEDRAKATSNFMGAIPLSSVLGSPLAGWILGRAWLGINGWRWLFVAEGMPAIVLGAVAYFFLTDRPADAQWLDAEHREWLRHTLHQENPVREKAITVWQALKSRTILLLAALTFFCYLQLYTFVFWFPTLLKRGSGLTDMRVGLWGTIPFLATFLAMQINGWHSDKTRERHWHSAMCLFIAACGLLLLIVAQPRSVPVLVGLFTMVGLGYAYLPTFWAIPAEILTHAEVATTVGLVNAVGSVAGFAGPYAFGYLHTRTGTFSYGLGMTMLAALAGGLLILRLPRPPAPISD